MRFLKSRDFNKKLNTIKILIKNCWWQRTKSKVSLYRTFIVNQLYMQLRKLIGWNVYETWTIGKNGKKKTKYWLSNWLNTLTNSWYHLYNPSFHPYRGFYFCKFINLLPVYCRRIKNSQFYMKLLHFLNVWKLKWQIESLQLPNWVRKVPRPTSSTPTLSFIRWSISQNIKNKKSNVIQIFIFTFYILFSIFNCQIGRIEEN